jgi:hypothetical protein
VHLRLDHDASGQNRLDDLHATGPCLTSCCRYWP